MAIPLCHLGSSPFLADKIYLDFSRNSKHISEIFGPRIPRKVTNILKFLTAGVGKLHKPSDLVIIIRKILIRFLRHVVSDWFPGTLSDAANLKNLAHQLTKHCGKLRLCQKGEVVKQ
jgi:hypothetical protein